MTRLYILAGNWAEARAGFVGGDFAPQAPSNSPLEWRYPETIVTYVDCLARIRGAHDATLITYGTWEYRKDASEILQYAVAQGLTIKPWGDPS